MTTKKVVRKLGANHIFPGEGAIGLAPALKMYLLNLRSCVKNAEPRTMRIQSDMSQRY